MNEELAMQMQNWMIEVAARQAALGAMLVGAGICTEEELTTLTAQLVSKADQMVAAKRAEAEAAFDAKNPGLRKLFGKLMGLEVEGG